MPMPGDPIILKAFLLNFDAVWADEVDKLYICLNIDQRTPDQVRDYDIALLDEHPKVEFVVVDEMLFQGAALRRLLEEVKEDIIFSIEDDTVIIKQGQVDKCFRKIETGEADVVGSPRFSCSQEILDASAEKYDLDYSGYGDKGPNLWPNFFFARKADLLKTDLHFEPKGWEPGERIEELDITAKEVIAADVFVWLCIQLRAMGKIFYDVPQGHSHPDDIVDMAMGTGLGDPNLPWIHIGSLTMTMEDLIIQSVEPREHGNKPKTGIEKQEICRRFAWLRLFMEVTAGKMEGMDDMRLSYDNKMKEFITAFGLSQQLIDNYLKVYRRFIQW